MFTFDVPAGGDRDVVVSLGSEDGATRFSLRSACGDEATALGCVRGSPAGARFRSVAPGSYALIVEGPARREIDYRLDLRLEDPTPRPTGDVCADPIDTPLDQVVVGTLADKLDDFPTSCAPFYRDAVHRFVLPERRDVTIDLLAGDRGGDYVIGVTGPTCEPGIGGAGLCLGGTPAELVLRDVAAGEHYLVVEAPGAPSYQLRIQTAPPTAVIEASGNDTCEEAIVVPEQGLVVYRGSTRGLTDDVNYPYCGSGTRSPDAAFLLDLGADTDVRISTEGSDFDTVLMVHPESRACVGFPAVCNDDSGSGSTSLIERTLSAGRYHIVVDGYGANSEGTYVLTIARNP